MSTVTFSASEFNQIQQELVGLKQSKYELQDQNRKLTVELNRLKLVETEFKKLQNVVQKSKEKNALQKSQADIENLQRTIEMMNTEHREQNEALRNNVQLMFDRNKQMGEERDKAISERVRLESRIVDLKKQELQFNEFRRLVKETLEGHEELLAKILPASAESETTSAETSSEPSSQITSNTTNIAVDVNHVADQDLLNNITRLEDELKEQEKKYKRHIENLEQQNEVWKEKNKRRIETEQELADSMENLEKLKKQLLDQQQLVNELVEEREKGNRDYQALVEKMTNRDTERNQLQSANEQLNQRLGNLQRQLTTANQMRENLRKDTIDLNKRIVALEQSEASLLKTLEEYKIYKHNLSAVTENLEALQQQYRSLNNQLANVTNENTKLKDQCREIEIVKQKLEQSERKVQRLTQSYNEAQSSVRKLTDSIQTIQIQLDQCSSTLIHHFVESTIAHWASKLTLEDYEELNEQAQKVPELLARLDQAELQASEFQLKLKDTKTEYLLLIKKNNKLVKELKSQLQILQAQNQQLQHAKDLAVSTAANSPRPLLRGNSFQEPETPTSPKTTPPNRRGALHQRSSSSSSTGSIDINGSFSSPISSLAGSQLQQQIDQLTKDNALLLTRVSELQQNKWNMTEKVRHLEESVMLMQEELEKKQAIIQHYVSRERIGRIAPEQERWTNTIKRKQEQKLQQPNQTINADAYKHMQQVMQETLLHNIQLQKDIRTLGEEISRLLKETEALKEKNMEISQQIDSSSTASQQQSS